MRILFAATSADNFFGASKGLCELAVAFKQKGHDVDVALPKREGALEKTLMQKQISFFVIRQYQCWYRHLDEEFSSSNRLLQIKRFLNELSVKKCRKILRDRQYDVVHVNASTAYVVGKAAVEEQIPTVWHLREFLEEDLHITFCDPNFSLRILNQANRFIAISKAVGEKWSSRLSVPIEVIYNGISKEQYYIESKEPREEIHVILYGRIARAKGQLFYINAAIEVLKQTNQPCRFYFAGKIEEDAYYDECIRRIQKSGFHDKILYLGEITNVKDMLSQMDVVCVCSAMEGFGRVTAEAMLGGCFVLGANTGGTKELITDMETGRLYESENLNDMTEKLLDILEHFDQYHSIIQNGQHNALERFTADQNADRIESLYQKVIMEQKSKNEQIIV